MGYGKTVFIVYSVIEGEEAGRLFGGDLDYNRTGF